MFFIGPISEVNATNYEMGVELDEVLIWKCNVCNHEKMEQLFGNEWNGKGNGFFENLKEGDRMKMAPKSMSSDVETVSVMFSIWSWTDASEWGDKDCEERYTFFKNPDHMPKDYIFPNLAPLVLLGPIDQYLNDIEPNLYDGYFVETTFVWTLNCELNEAELDGKYPTEYIKVLATYTDKGILRTYKLYVTDHHVMIDISLDYPFSYQLPAFLAILIGSSIGIVILYKRIKANPL